MIQLNLLPDVKLDYIKAQRTQRLVISIAFLATAASVAILILMLGIDGLQKKHLSDLNKNITSQSSQLKGKPQILQILTVQNQLESLTALHAGKPAVTQLFTYLNEVTPASVSINNFNIDFTQHTTTITGSADALSSVNTYVDTLKATTYTTDKVTTPATAFSNIVLSSFGLNTNAGSQPAQFTITLSYDQNIFDITQSIKLNVPSQTVTRINAGVASDLFKASSTTSGGGQ